MSSMYVCLNLSLHSATLIPADPEAISVCNHNSVIFIRMFFYKFLFLAVASNFQIVLGFIKVHIKDIDSSLIKVKLVAYLQP